MAKKFTKKTALEEHTFEQSLQKLEGIVERLETGSIPLDETLREFEEGMRLIKTCNEKLNRAESQLKILMKDAQGNITAEDSGKPG